MVDIWFLLDLAQSKVTSVTLVRWNACMYKQKSLRSRSVDGLESVMEWVGA